MQAKASSPGPLLRKESVPDVIGFYFEANHLKQLFRQGWLQRGVSSVRCESVADHSFAVVLLAMILADRYSPDLDLSRVLQLAILHDLGEIDAGDITPADGLSEDEKLHRETESMKRVFGILEDGQKYLDLWSEYVEGRSPEAVFVRQVEKLEMALQAGVYEHQGAGEEFRDFYESASKSLRRPELRQILRSLLEIREASDHGSSHGD